MVAPRDTWGWRRAVDRAAKVRSLWPICRCSFCARLDREQNPRRAFSPEQRTRRGTKERKRRPQARQQRDQRRR